VKGAVRVLGGFSHSLSRSLSLLSGGPEQPTSEGPSLRSTPVTELWSPADGDYGREITLTKIMAGHPLRELAGNKHRKRYIIFFCLGCFASSFGKREE